MAQPVVIDLETQHTFREFSSPASLKVSVAGIYDYNSSKSYIFEEQELQSLFPLLENASVIVGFNIVSFDLPVLQPYYTGDLEKLPKFDILDDIKLKLGRRIGLNDVVGATLGKKKSGHGLQAIDFFREGQMEKLKSYCLDDVMLTKELFDTGVEKGEIRIPTPVGSSTLVVDWKNVLSKSQNADVSLTLPF